MDGFHFFLTLMFFVFFIFFPFHVKGVLEIVKPLPGHQAAIEGERIQSTCIAFDYANETVPLKIVFEKIINQFGDKVAIVDEGPSGNYTYISKFEENGRKLSTTLVINKMSESLKDGYVCSALYNSSRGQRQVTYGFGITYIPKNDLPTITVSNKVKTQFGKSATLSCNLTKAAHQSNLVRLNKIAWFKNDELRNEETKLEDKRLKDIQLAMNSPEDAGTYTCRLFLTLQGIRDYTIEGKIAVEITPQFTAKDLDDNEVIRKKGESVMFACDARGNPIKISWKKKPRSGGETTFHPDSMKNDSDAHYRFSDDQSRLEGFWLEIPKTDYSDRGDYQCCFNSTDSKEQCQTFTLRVKDPLGYLWPLIGIIIEAILIVIILVIAARLKSNSRNASASKTVKQTELEYTVTDEGARGHVRLRNTGATTN